MTYDCIIIGAGASGLFCSATFAKTVHGLILEDKTSRNQAFDERRRSV